MSTSNIVDELDIAQITSNVQIDNMKLKIHILICNINKHIIEIYRRITLMVTFDIVVMECSFCNKFDVHLK